MRLSIYQVCGLLVDSELQLPLAPAQALRGNVDVRVCRDLVPLPLRNENGGANWQASEGRVLFRVPGIVRFMICAGAEVRFELEGHATDADAIPFLLSTALAALLHQRKLLTLHAGAVSLGGQAIALCGPSGVGKSTLIASLCVAGCELLGDDVSVIQADASGQPRLMPDGRSHQLWLDSIEHFHLTGRQGPAVREGVRKFHVAPAIAIPSDPLPLKTVVVLRDIGQPVAAKIYPLRSADAMAALMNSIYCRPLATQLGHQGQSFKQIAALLSQTRVLCVDRHPSFEQLADDTRLLLEHLQ
ncbi:hypothetical protein SAMN05216593_101536 [Pseudomonas asturiensis]|uniref:Hpr(Ser) kinase/phosphatase n=1 Tax=Pseudomonas asturiensis TaxID=1190415 RepID=A0A1M7JSV5_9PSED|nr:hypothetical protein SAMN05216593_101536 [Pseudomonas asturiensis]